MLLSHDSKYLFSVNDTILNVYSVTSGEIVYRLSYTDCSPLKDESKNEIKIVSICLNPFNKYQLLSFHLNSVICLWDYDDGLLLKSFETNIKMRKIINVNSSIYAVGELKKSKKSDNNSTTGLYRLLIDNSLKNKNSIDHELILANLSLNLDKLEIAIDCNERYAAFIEARKKLVISHFKQNNLIQKYKSKTELTCLAMHPNEDCIATGTTSGKIIVWYNYLKQQNNADEDNDPKKKSNDTAKPTESVLHWHSLPVLSLTFTTEGSILLSGGHECVLVKWLFKTGQKDFKPRLGAPISAIASSVDNTLYATKHLDNTLHLIGANMKIVQTFSSFLCPNFKAANRDLLNSMDFTLYPCGLTYFKRLNCLVTNGKPGHLQFYSFDTDKLLFNLDIVNENYISPENLNRPNVHTEIECLAFNYDYTWLVTVERRDDLTTTPEIKLKFWNYNPTNNKFSLNTLVRHPHSYDRITKVVFKPNENILYTCGQDGCFKSWTLVKNRQSSTDPNQTRFNWVYNTCNGYRDMIPNDIEFFNFNNRDYLAVSFKHIVSLWRKEYDGSLSFIDDLIHCSKNDPIKYLIKIDHSNLLVVHNECLNVWNLKATNSNEVDSLLVGDESLETNCTWTQQIENVLKVDKNPLQESGVVVFAMENLKHDESLIKLKIGTINISNSKNQHPTFKYVQELAVSMNGLVNFVIVPKENSNSKGEFNLNELDIFYADNFGLVKKIKQSESDSIQVNLEDSMWKSRKILSKNLPESNLARIIDTNKSNRLNLDNDQFVDENRNELFEKNLSKIETTPAYLMPKIGAFCYVTLKSMLFKMDETKYELENKLS